MEFKPGFHFIQYFLNVKKLVEINFCLQVVPIRLPGIILLEDTGRQAITALLFVSDQIEGQKGATESCILFLTKPWGVGWAARNTLVPKT